MTEQNSKPVLIFDGDCGFCRLWIQRWESGAKGRVEYRTSKEAAQDHPDIPATEFQQAVQWVDGETRSSGAKAIFQMLAVIHPRWAPFWKALVAWGLFMALADFAYGMVAKYRYFFSSLVRIFHGGDLRPATYGISQKLFLRLIAVVYAIALLSFFVQADGLVGEKGITPAVDFFKGAEAQLGGIDLLKIPSIFWWGAGDLALKGWTLAGVGVCVLVFLGVAPLGYAAAGGGVFVHIPGASRITCSRAGESSQVDPWVDDLVAVSADFFVGYRETDQRRLGLG